MQRQTWLASLTCLLLIPVAACNFTPDPTRTPTAPETPSPAPTDTPTPISTAVPPSATPSPTISLAFASPKEQRLNCRFGPDTVYAVVGALEVGQSTQIAGSTADGSWWYVHDPGNPGGLCWVLAELTEVSGDVTGLPVVAPQPVSVTRIEMAVAPPHRSVDCASFPQTFYVTAEITANGPAVVNWRWEVVPGESSPESALIFTESGTQVLENYYLAPAANAYTMTLHVLGPNDRTAQINFRVDCTP
jgi:uncharacterized protein YraI